MFIILFFIGCSQNSNQNKINLENQTSITKSICGNGILESGETAKNCCLDAGCSNFFVCKELNQGKNIINTCVKEKLVSTQEYKNFLKYYDEETFEYSKERNLINYDIILSKINQMNRSISKLKSNYNVSIEEIIIKYRYDRTNWNVKWIKLYNSLSKEFNKNKKKIK